MSRRTKSKAARRTAATALPHAHPSNAPRPRRASPKVLGALAAIVLLAGVASVLAVVLSGRGASTVPQVAPVGSVRDGVPGAADVDALLEGIPQNGMTLGSPRAPVTLIEYIDLQCPYCRQIEAQVLPDVLRRYVRPGKLKIVARPLAFIGPADSIRGRNAMIAASNQNRAFNFAQLLYFNQGTENTGWLSEQMVTQAAASIPGLDVALLLAQRNGSDVSKLASRYDALRVSDDVAGAPTFLVEKSARPGTAVMLVNPPEKSLTAALDAALGT